MAKQTPKQKQKIEQVMHDFKEGDLTSSTGAKVKSPKQAIAIALSEAGASNKPDAKANRARPAKKPAKSSDDR